MKLPFVKGAVKMAEIKKYATKSPTTDQPTPTLMRKASSLDKHQKQFSMKLQRTGSSEAESKSSVATQLNEQRHLLV
mgnify:CR=1 FL=1